MAPFDPLEMPLLETLSTISTVIKGVFNIFAYPALLVCCQTHFTSGAKSIAKAYKYGSAKQSSSVVKVVGKSEIGLGLG